MRHTLGKITPISKPRLFAAPSTGSDWLAIVVAKTQSQNHSQDTITDTQTQ